MEFTYVLPGTFEMGSADDESGRDADEHLHTVHVVSGFYLQTTPVTQTQWESVMEDNRSHFRDGDRPVENVSWDDAHEFIERLNEMEKAGHFRLPTEAEREYACRAGTNTAFYAGNGERDLDRAGWYDGNSGGQTHPVGEKESNSWGLYDMHGNVWEWVEDDHHRGYHKAPVDGKAWVDTPRGWYRGVRGGSWIGGAPNCRSATRGFGPPDTRGSNFGLRLARFASEGKE